MRATQDEMIWMHRWMERYLLTAKIDLEEEIRPEEQGVELPFSFTYGGQLSAELLKTWETERSSEQLDEGRTQHTLNYTDPETELNVRCVAIEYEDFPTIEWVLYFENTGSADTPIIENIQALDIQLERGANGEFLLHHAVGSPADGSDYGPLETSLGPGVTKRISAAGGRPTNSDLSYFNLEWNGEGMIIVVGWPGQWAAEFVRDRANGIRIKAGQERAHFKLFPGEEVRSPLIVLQAWKGDWIRGQNIWKGSSLAFLLKDVVPMTMFGLLIFSFSVMKFQKHVG